ncbi:hypothetical protein [Pseudaestuariivita rosea]|uniref:hypothetical protein n=1 Tax=Pseudaestuariivita rosea TaxID=2763263 RepID=UPI001ABA0B5F|nr:hypothetical protein [Pseudaestuariivita rosea]
MAKPILWFLSRLLIIALLAEIYAWNTDASPALWLFGFAVLLGSMTAVSVSQATYETIETGGNWQVRKVDSLEATPTSKVLYQLFRLRWLAIALLCLIAAVLYADFSTKGSLIKSILDIPSEKP